MPKHIDNVPKLADFRPPWITADGTEAEINKDTLVKYIHNILTDKAKAQDARDELVESNKALEAERDTLKGEVDSKDPDSAGKIAKLEAKIKDGEAKLAKSELDLARVEIASEKGLTAKQAKRLQGATREELEADADELVEDLGLKKTEETDEEREEREEREAEEAESGRTTPQFQRHLVNGGDGKSGSDAQYDYDAIAAQIDGNKIL